MKRNSTIILIAVVSILLIGRIIYVQTGKKTIQTKYPIDKIVLERNVIMIHASKNVELADIINLDIFKGLRPDMSSGKITALLGEPSDTSNQFDSRFLVYYTDKGRIETGVSSGVLSNDQFYNTGICMFYKQDISKDFIFKSSILKYLPDDISDKQVGVFINEKCDFVVNFSSKKEDWIQWMVEN